MRGRRMNTLSLGCSAPDLTMIHPYNFPSMKALASLLHFIHFSKKRILRHGTNGYFSYIINPGDAS